MIVNYKIETLTQTIDKCLLNVLVFTHTLFALQVTAKANTEGMPTIAVTERLAIHCTFTIESGSLKVTLERSVVASGAGGI
jgi:hypothetical protein